MRRCGLGQRLGRIEHRIEAKLGSRRGGPRGIGDDERPVPTGEHDRFANHRQQLGRRDDCARAAVGEQIREIGRRKERVDRHRNGTVRDRAEEGGGEVDRVEQDEQDALLAEDAERGECAGEGVDARGELRVRRAAVFVDECQAIGVRGKVALDEIGRGVIGRAVRQYRGPHVHEGSNSCRARRTAPAMATADAPVTDAPVDFATAPERYRHWRLAVDGRVATLALAVDEHAGLRPGYKLKLNSYDLGVDIELHDALNRIRFEHPAVGCVVITSAVDRVFSAGANIYMLGRSSHGWKVNFCKFTNETRNGMEDSSRDGLAFLGAVNGTCAGGGYELVLACDEILMVDDRSTTVSLPEVPLLGVLPGTGGLTRVIDKRKVRRDVADLFCTNADGVRAQRAKAWGLVDEIAPPSEFAALVQARAASAAARSSRDPQASGIALHPLQRSIGEAELRYRHVQVALDRAARSATLTVHAPSAPEPATPAAIVARGDAWWPLAVGRELDDAILHLRHNEPKLGVIVLRTAGDPENVLAVGRTLTAAHECWLVRETAGLLRRTLARLDVAARSLYALIEPGSCFAGPLLELALAADRIYMLAGEDGGPTLALDATNFGLLAAVNGRSRLATRFNDDTEALARLRAAAGRALQTNEALELGLVTVAPDELDWDDEIRLAVEERAALSPDALSGLEASLRFPGAESLWTKIFGRLSAWQNWVFIRPNATGERGALKLFGTGSKPQFDVERV